jgi:hypothetical protein
MDKGHDFSSAAEIRTETGAYKVSQSGSADLGSGSTFFQYDLKGQTDPRSALRL